VPAFVQVTLDTTAPTVQWGAVDRGATTITVPYELSEPGQLYPVATVDGNLTTAQVSLSEVTIDVPLFWQHATLIATLVDQVGNEREVLLQIYSAGNRPGPGHIETHPIGHINPSTPGRIAGGLPGHITPTVPGRILGGQPGHIEDPN
jgi:hypothetical protein